MEWSQNEKQVWSSIEKWEQEYFTYVPTDFNRAYEKTFEDVFNRISPKIREKALQTIDNLLFHLHSIILNSQFQQDTKQRVLLSAQSMNKDVEVWEDVQDCRIEQLRYIAQHQVAKHRLLSFAQGGLSGGGGILFLGIDIPASIAAHLRSIQVLALSYGYSINQPYETMLSLKLFHAATLPKQHQLQGWEQLMSEVLEQDINPYLFESDELVADSQWMRHLVGLVGKGMVLFMLRKRLIQGIPLMGMVYGATANYQLSRQITDFANQFYQKRWLLEKHG
ncbi:EcsC family protein [Pseudalkalibacillus salsuginis]|uniref:EcsC family protein n=1 Tax=Pseudalkalibacillus salsuginis TaxID=2910972 RepID=UPI001F2883EB|nr:EcsC family protein [Pseudalkalibacillus salsuginis]MCF6408769.1 EcsC family protein [Pseudalkalibacillus salsuginis]